MNHLLLIYLASTILSSLVGCVSPPPTRHGDFILSGDFRIPKNNRILASPRFTTIAVRKQKLTFTATRLPVAIDPLDVGLSIVGIEHRKPNVSQSSTTPERGILKIEAFCFPDRKPIGTFFYHQSSDQKLYDQRITRYSKVRKMKNFTLTISSNEAFHPDHDFAINYVVKLK